jgi:conjugal transfer mating pair stabilization protein TraN
MFQIQGGNTPFCMDGSCRDQGWEPNDELMSSLAQLSILKEMQGQLEGGILFKGTDNRCSKYTLSFKDCCGSEKGWGKDLGLSSCKADEKLLSKRRKKGLCHMVGTYCDKKVLNKCVKKKTSYCCFGSKLLKAFHEQGRAQIGMGWGEPEEPLCRGFTIEEIQQIDFSKLDLSEFFEDLMKTYSPSKMGNITQQVGDRLEAIKKGMVPGYKQPKQREEGA